MNEDLRQRVKKIRLLALDVDGVLTDGGVYIFEDGTEFRRFNIKDGLGLKMVMEAGIEVAIISSSDVEAVRHRCSRLGISEVHLGIKDKLTCLQEICSRLNLSLEQVAYMGDDLPDLPVLNQVGLPCAPADAFRTIQQVAVFVTCSSGGHGGVRELCELLLKGFVKEY